MLNTWPLNRALATLYEISSHSRSYFADTGLKMMPIPPYADPSRDPELKRDKEASSSGVLISEPSTMPLIRVSETHIMSML
jgi:hypothetical protein